MSLGPLHWVDGDPLEFQKTVVSLLIMFKTGLMRTKEKKKTKLKCKNADDLTAAHLGSVSLALSQV